MKQLLLFSSLLMCTLLKAQGIYPSGGRAMSMANAMTAVNDEWAYFFNPAGTAEIDGFKAGISYENRFLLKETQSQALTASMPLGKGVLTLGGHHYGYRELRSYKGGLGYAMKLAEKFSMGVQLNYMGLSLNENYGSIATLGADAGVMAELAPNWNVGFSVLNIGRAKLSDYADDRFSTAMRLGTSYRFSKRVLMSLDADKDLDEALRVRTGIEYEAADHFYLRGGFASNALELTFGLGYKISMFRIDMGTSFDQFLGWSPHFSLVFLNKEKAE